MDKITEKGIDFALDVLEKTGHLADMPAESLTQNLLYLDRACDAYTIASNIKGDDRTDEEVLDAVLIFFFQKYIRECLHGAA